MNFVRSLSFVYAFTLFLAIASGRAVNISNTWMLPEEGFPVFYRYFRDRISWYEADAVCQFHHANLVTADNTSQYDAIRAYLKELDITDNVWIGLSKSSERPNFTWTDFKPMNGEGHWREMIPSGSEPLCVTMDPAADFLWKPLPCGGPEAASFICELAVPSWAMGPEGCLLTELPSLTVLYIPEQMALELTSDCGLDGTKRIACKGNANREELLKQLSCSMAGDDFEEKSTKAAPITSTQSEISSDENSVHVKTTKPWTSNTVDIDYGMPTRHRRETEDTLSPLSTESARDVSTKGLDMGKVTTELLTTSPTSTNSNFDTQVTTVAPSADSTPDASVSRHDDKSVEQGLRAATGTSSPRPASQDTDVDVRQRQKQTPTATSAVATAAPTAETSAEEPAAGEYPSAINQGQLFSIIENGTMFDIIELNETGNEEVKISHNPTPKSTKDHENSLKVSTTKSAENIYTTTALNKEASDSTATTTKPAKKSNKTLKKQLIKESDPKKANYPSDKEIRKQKISKEFNTTDIEVEKNLTKEVEMFAVLTGPQIKLNRTHRKELPMLEDFDNKTRESLENSETQKQLNLSITNDLNLEHHVEIKLHEPGKKNVTTGSFLVTTKRVKRPGVTNEPEVEDMIKTEVPKQTVETVIDPKIDLLNKNGTINNETETIETKVVKEHFLPAALLGETPVSSAEVEDFMSPGVPTQNAVQTEPVTQGRPNRQRQLIKPQRRSFYPYFFSRVLG